MFDLIARHGFIVILTAVLIEEFGVPMPIPTDILIVLAGIESGGEIPRLILWFIVLSCASAAGATGLYFMVRKGGRPLVDRFGRYVHLGPEQLARGEALLQRRGWFGIAIGRAVPGLRYATVIVCGLLKVPYWRFLTAHIVGSSLYIVTFLALGAVFGDKVIESLHTPSRTLHLLWLLLIALGLPLLIMWLTWRAHPQVPANPSKERLFWSNVLAGLLGAMVLAATWAAAATYADLIGPARPINTIATLLRWLLNHGLEAGRAYALVYSGLLLLCLGVSAVYYQFIVPRLAPRITSLPLQVVELALLTGGLLGGFLALTLLVFRVGPLLRWWERGGVWLLLVLGIGVVGYAFTTAYGRTLGLAVLPSLRRVGLGTTTRRALEAEVVQHLAPEQDSTQNDASAPRTIIERARPQSNNGRAVRVADHATTSDNAPVTQHPDDSSPSDEPALAHDEPVTTER